VCTDYFLEDSVICVRLVVLGNNKMYGVVVVVLLQTNNSFTHCLRFHEDDDAQNATPDRSNDGSFILIGDNHTQGIARHGRYIYVEKRCRYYAPPSVYSCPWHYGRPRMTLPDRLYR